MSLRADLVTDGLAEQYPNRAQRPPASPSPNVAPTSSLACGTGVRDFPPDETALIGAAVGFSQVGLLPICEIPYAKYLDCGYDQFEEAAIAHWLSNGQSPNGDHASAAPRASVELARSD